MALLNFSKTYEGILDKIGTPGYLQSTDLLFTRDGHIVTHGVDYIPWGNGTIPIEKLPIDTTGDIHNNDTLWTSETIYNKINNSFLANEAMRFKGSIGIEGRDYTINGERTPDGTLPKGEVGDTYRVSTNGSYGSNDCEVGDLLICYESGTTKETDGWTVVQTNINGYNTFRINGTPYNLYTTDLRASFEIYAPTSAGSANGQILLWDDDKKEAVWADREALNIGQYLKAGTGLWIGTGNTVDNTGYNGSAEKTINLVQATTGTIGGVIIDRDDLALNNKTTPTDGQARENGATISISDTGVIYLTKQNIINALGYAPEGQGAVKSTWRPIKVNNEDFLDNNAAGASLNMGSANSTIAITKSTDNSGNVSFDVNLGYDITKDTSTSGLKRVAVKAGEGTNLGKLYVEIPEYDVVSNVINGLAPKIITDETDTIDPSYYILASKEGISASWYKLDIDAINTWRPISIATKDLENRSLKIVQTDNVVFTYNEDEFNQGKAATFGIELQWKEWTE